MQSLLRKYNDLSVTSSFDKDEFFADENTISDIISHYIDLQIYKDYGERNVDYICELAVRFAYMTILSTDKNAMTAYALWLSNIWLIDGYFDKFKNKATKDIIKNLKHIFNGKFVYTNDPLLSATKEIYTKYMRLIGTYDKYPSIMIRHWLFRYLDTLLYDPVNTEWKSKSEGNISYYIDMGSEQYTTWRLDSGCMMCITWHAILFNPQVKYSSQFDIVMKFVSIAISFHNDLVSFRRDYQQRTPNVVLILKGTYEDDFESMKQAINVTNYVYKQIYDEVLNISTNEYSKSDVFVLELMLDILEGYHIWSNLETRYADGIKMLHYVLGNNSVDFYKMLLQKDKSAGDPN